VREHAPGGHGRRRVQERRQRRAAQGAAELLVPAGVGDVADLGGGQRGARRRRRQRQPRGGRQQRQRRGAWVQRHPGVPDGRPRVRRLAGRGVAVADVRREAPPRLRPRAAAAAGAAAQPAQRKEQGRQGGLGGDGGDREVPPVPGRRPLQDPRQARVRHPPAQHRRAGEEDEDQRADTEAAGARAQHGKANQHCRHAGSGRGLHQGSSEAGQ
ncbi:hypothetical protein ACJX0J_031708, partial [Zea mays]